MQKVFIGRETEKSILIDAYQHHDSRFVAVFGRRRVGKTFLIRQCLADKITFQVTAFANEGTKQ